MQLLQRLLFPSHTHIRTFHLLQLKALLTTVEAFDKDTLGKKFLRYKPLLPVLEDRQGWWRYAITAVVEEDVKRRTQMWSWKHIKEHRWVEPKRSCDCRVIIT